MASERFQCDPGETVRGSPQHRKSDFGIFNETKRCVRCSDNAVAAHLARVLSSEKNGPSFSVRPVHLTIDGKLLSNNPSELTIGTC